MKTYIIRIFLFFITLSLPSFAMAQSKATADEAYSKERYNDALHIYQSLVKQGESAEVYYNLANCYYRLDSIAQAILWYERALVLEPGDNDIRFNLRLARTKTIDKIIPEEELFFVRWFRSLLNMFSVSGWQTISILLFVLSLISFGCYFLCSGLMFRKLGFYGGFVFLLLVVASNIMAWQQQQRQHVHNRTILMEQAVTVKSTPSENGTDLFLLHNGTSMQIIDDSMPEWYQIKLSDGKEGWISSKSVELI